MRRSTVPKAKIRAEHYCRLPVYARWAVSTIFFLNGMVLASWVPHIPTVKTQHGLSDGQLGLVLLSMAIGSVCTLPVAGWLVGRFGSRRMTTMAILVFCLILSLPVLSSNVLLLCLALGLFGVCNSTLDVSMNAQAVEVEHRYQRAIMSSFHALFSFGGLVGAAVAGLVMSWNVGAIQHVMTTTFVSVLIAAFMVRWLLPSVPQAKETEATYVKPTGTLFRLGSLAFLGLLAEGSMADWSAVFLQHDLHASAAVASFGFAAFSLAMAVGRFSGDFLVNRFGPAVLLRVSSMIAACGLGLGVLIGEPIAAIIGFGLVGLGIANIIPVLFSAAGQVHGVAPGIALAAVASTGYCGFLAGPPLIGLAAELTSLTVGLCLVSACCVFISMSARTALQRSHSNCLGYAE
jgi:MFS family permease